MTERIVDRPERVFQVWAYTVGMGRLLLRSTKSETFPTRVDVLFQNVKAMSLPTLVDGLAVTIADRASEERITAETGFLPDEDTTFFQLNTSRGVGYVVAGVVALDEDEGEYFESSRYWPGTEGIPR